MNLATVSAVTYTDTTIDPYLQYNYRVVDSASGNGESRPGHCGPATAGVKVCFPAP